MPSKIDNFLTTRFSLPRNDQTDAPSSWFSTQVERWASSKYTPINTMTKEAITTLQAFHDRRLDAASAAQQITAPISTSPVPDLGTYSDDSAALTSFWHVLTTALVEWPRTRTDDLLALLTAIGAQPQPGGIHQGQATDPDGKAPLTWSTWPYFGLVWYGASSRQPQQADREGAAAELSSEDARVHEAAQAVYARLMELEARLVEAGILKPKAG